MFEYLRLRSFSTKSIVDDVNSQSGFMQRTIKSLPFPAETTLETISEKSG
jgi:hypothetical protein